MLRKHKRARLLILSPLVLGLFIWMVPNIWVPLGVTTYDLATNSSCAKDVEGAVDAFAKRSDAMDYARSDALIGQDMAASLRTLRQQVADTHCPSYSEQAKTELLTALDQSIDMMEAIAHGAPPDFVAIQKSFGYDREKLDALRKVLGETVPSS